MASNWLLLRDVRNFLILLLLGTVFFCPDLHAEHVYPFQGHLNLADKNVELAVKMDDETALNLKVEHNQDDTYQAVINLDHVHTPFFDMTTEIQSVMDIHKQDRNVTGISGQFSSRYSLIDHKTVPEMSGRFDLKGGVLRIDDLVVGDIRAEGSVDLAAGHNLDLSLHFESIDISYFLDWISGGKKKFVGSGEISGQISLTGRPEKILLKANIDSQNGYIESLQYDVMELHLQGVYPVVELTGSKISKTNGFSFELDGIVDLSDKKNMDAQIKTIKKIPLIKDDNLQSEWVLKRVESPDGSESFETKYFIKKDKGVSWSGEEDAGVFGVEKKIGF